MVLKQTSASTSSRLYLNALRAMVAIIIIAMVMDYYVKGGIAQVAQFRIWVTYSLPLSAFAMAAMACRSFIIIMRRKGPYWYQYIAFFATFIPMTILGLVNGLNDPNMMSFIYIFSLIGVGAIIALSYGSALIQAYIRAFHASNWLKLWLLAITIIGLVGTTPLGFLTFPGFFSLWDRVVILNITGPSSTWLSGGLTIATIVQVARVLFFKEDLIPE